MTTSRRVSILDVAAAAGVSKSAASRALLHQPGVSEDLAQRVQAAAHQLGYVKDFRAHALRSASTTTIGVLVRTVRFDFYAELIALMQHHIEQAGYRTAFMGASDLDPTGNTALANLAGLRPDSVIIASGRIPLPVLERFARTTPVTLVGPQVTSPALACVSDDAHGTHELPRRVHEAGHHDVGLVVYPENRSLTLHRRSALLHRELDALGLTVTPIAANPTRDAPDTDALHRALPHVTAIMCPNDPTLMSTWETLQTWGLTIPTDVSLTGYDGIGQLASPVLSLTTWRQNIEKIATQAAAEALRLAHSPATPPRHITVRGRYQPGHTLADQTPRRSSSDVNSR